MIVVNVNIIYSKNYLLTVCIGDSGGALYTKTTDSNKRRMLVGISILSLDIRGNANCLDGHKTIFYHAGKFGSAILQTVDAYNTKYNENKLIFPVLQI